MRSLERTLGTGPRLAARSGGPGQPRREALLRSARRFARSALWWLLGLCLPLLAWEALALSGRVNPVIWPPPHLWLVEALEQPRLLSLEIAAPRYGAHFVALTAIVATLKRVAVGVLLALVAALLVGSLAFSWRLFGNLVLPLATALAAIVPIGWLPLALVAFGVGDPAAYFVVFVGSFFKLTVAVVQLMRDVDPVYVQTALVLGASRTQVVRHVLLPGILPNLFVTLRVVVLLAWIVVLSAEVLGVSTGLAAIIAAGSQMMNHRLMYLGMALVCLVGVLLDRALGLLERRVIWWRGLARL